MLKYLVFVDIDGVLTSARAQMSHNASYMIWSKFDPIAIDFFNRIHDTFVGVEFIIMSTWRHIDGFQDREAGHAPHWVQSAFANAGFRGTISLNWKTGETSRTGPQRRAYEVKEYLADNPCDDYILFDDDWDFNNVLGKKRHIKTDSQNGLLFKHMEKAWSICGMWKRRADQ